MKSILVSFLIITMQLPALVLASGEKPRSVVFRVYSEDKKPELKTIPGMKQKTVGIALTSAGLGLLGVGAILMASSKWQKIQTASGTSLNTNDPQGAIGMLMLLPGVGLTIPGGIVWGAGARKIKRYRNGTLQKRETVIPKKPATADPEAIPKQERY